MIHLVSLDSAYQPEELVALQDQFRDNGVFLVHLWEDVWETRSIQVLGRIQSLLGLNKQIHARKTKVTAISQAQADAFLHANHIQASARAKYRYALVADNTIVAVACFSNLRLMRKMGPAYKSAEVIRFASLIGYTVTGGFSKLMKYFIRHYSPDDIMSYADRDWSNGKVYEQGGFKLVSFTAPSVIYLDREKMVRYFPHRIPGQINGISESAADGENLKFVKIFNTGNLKYIHYL